ncbi:MAG: phosphate propanoyltransferase [Candidatus Hodarchaeales archaeon]|jgi:citrate synthase
MKMIEEHSHKSTGLRGVEVADTNICLIDGEKGELFIRGYNIKDLANNSTYEEVVYLLLYGDLPSKSQLKKISSLIRKYQELPEVLVEQLQKTSKNTPPMSVLQSSLALLAGYDTEVQKQTKEADQDIALRIIARIPIIVAAWERIQNNKEPIAPNKRLSHAANFLYMLHGEEPSKEAARVFDVSLILHAEHSFNASTFTARVIASTGADLYASISGAIGSLSGKYHGGANYLVYKSLLEIKKASDVKTWVEEQFKKGKRIMGMGHAVYRTMDPRAKILKKIASTLIKESPDQGDWMYHTTNEMIKHTQEEFRKRKGREIYPNVDLYGSSVYSCLNIPPRIFTPIFTSSRSAGWAAHVLEEKYPDTPSTKPVIYRPSADYVGRYCGPHGCTYTPLMERANNLDNRKLVTRFISEELPKVLNNNLVPVSLSARHIHLQKGHFETLFGKDRELTHFHPLTQKKEFACNETVDLVGPKRAIYGVRILGPFRKQTQVEISRSDGYVLGINPPTRQSGDLGGSPGIHLMGPRGAIKLKKGVIYAARHIHMSPAEAQKLGVTDKQVLAVSFPGTRAGILDEVMVRIKPRYSLELHLDLDEGNALAISDGDLAHLITDFDKKSYSPFR